ncbi:hypothetical protein MLD38_025500 [Melastoma candidum]|uniref:Uncharacterized protein n=1 Tax=Melastoma candidum TaxID=119954 RepID=A0ACB9NVJ8_9MYRT|nr:hypothetical protein MLD38_025500 [Melastoma candidum]
MDKNLTSIEVKMGIRRRDANPTSEKVGDANPTGERGNNGMETPNPGRAVDVEATVGATPLSGTHASTTSGVAPLSEISLASPILEAIHPFMDVRTEQVVVGQTVSTIVKSSLGPIGFNEKLVDDIEDENITDDGADGATTLKILEVEHPIVMGLGGGLAEFQEREVSNGMTEVSQYVEEKFIVKDDKCALSVQVVVIDPRELEEIQEMEMAKERIKKLLKAWANVFLSRKGIDDIALKYLVEASAIHVRLVWKEEMRHVAKAPYATMNSPIVDMEGAKTANTASLILRSVNDYMLDEMERVHPDASLIFERIGESNTMVLVEMRLTRHYQCTWYIQ